MQQKKERNSNSRGSAEVHGAVHYFAKRVYCDIQVVPPTTQTTSRESLCCKTSIKYGRLFYTRLLSSNKLRIVINDYLQTSALEQISAELRSASISTQPGSAPTYQIFSKSVISINSSNKRKETRGRLQSQYYGQDEVSQISCTSTGKQVCWVFTTESDDIKPCMDDIKIAAVANLHQEMYSTTQISKNLRAYYKAQMKVR